MGSEDWGWHGDGGLIRTAVVDKSYWGGSMVCGNVDHRAWCILVCRPMVGGHHIDEDGCACCCSRTVHPESKLTAHWENREGFSNGEKTDIRDGHGAKYLGELVPCEECLRGIRTRGLVGPSRRRGGHLSWRAGSQLVAPAVLRTIATTTWRA